MIYFSSAVVWDWLIDSWGWGWGLSLLCWPPLGLLRPTSSWPRPEFRSRLKIFGCWKNILDSKPGKHFTFPAGLKNSAVAAPIWSEHLHPPSCLCQGWRHLALFQSHLKRTVTGPAIKMDKSQSTLLCLLSISQISTKIHSKRALFGPGKQSFFLWQGNYCERTVGRLVSWGIVFDICDNPGHEQDCSEDKDKLVVSVKLINNNNLLK